MFSNTKVVLIAGHIGAGKTTVAQQLNKLALEQGYNSTVMSFATGVKTVARLMGWNEAKDDKGRQLLIDIGMAGRRYDPNTWTRLTFDIFLPERPNYPFDFVFVDDWRFLNELEFFNSTPWYKPITILVDSDRVIKTEFSNDPSETGLPKNIECGLYKYVVFNHSCSLDTLKDSLCPCILNDLIKEN